jgi:hypothetical protein
MNTFLAIGLGLLVLGFALIVLDFFLARLLTKMYPDPAFWDDANWSALDGADRKSLHQRRDWYFTAVGHRFRKYGLSLSIGGTALIGLELILRWIR